MELGSLKNYTSAGKRTTYDESAAGICKATAIIAHVGASRILEWLASFKLPDIAIPAYTTQGVAALQHHQTIVSIV